MLVIVQFPIADLRPFLDREYRLARPAWPRPETRHNVDFVRFFGRAYDRPLRSGDPAWPEEHAYCSAARAVRFVPLSGRSQIEAGPRYWRTVQAFRRLFSDGRAVVRLEVGFRVSAFPERSKGKLRDSDYFLYSVLHDFLKSGVCVPDGQSRLGRPIPLISAGRELARLFRVASEPSHNEASPSWTVQAGCPLIVVVSKINVPTPAATRVPPEAVAQASLAYAWMTFGQDHIPAWLMSTGAADPTSIRRLRSSLLRLHAENEVLDRVLGAGERGLLDSTPGTRPDSVLQQYCRDTMHLLQRQRWSGVDQSAIKAAYRAADWVAPGDEKQARLNALGHFRPQVLRPVAEWYMDRKAERVISVGNIQNGVVVVNTGVVLGGLEASQGRTENLELALDQLRDVVDATGLGKTYAEDAAAFAFAARTPGSPRAQLLSLGKRLIELGGLYEGASAIKAAVNAVLAALGQAQLP